MTVACPCQSTGCDECAALVGVLTAAKAVGVQERRNLCTFLSVSLGTQNYSEK